MDCFEKGLLTAEDTGGIELRFGNAEAMLGMKVLKDALEKKLKKLMEKSAEYSKVFSK